MITRFQWAASHLRCLPDYLTDRDIREALKELPQGLDKTYEHMVRELISATQPRNMRLCRRVFQMLLFAQRPLTLPELAVAISIEPKATDLDASTILTDPRSILALGGALLVYKPETNLVQFSHHTVREHLESLADNANAILRFNKAKSHAEIARSCLTYIQLPAVVDYLATKTFRDLQADESGEGNFAFVGYAAKYWIGHVQQTTMACKKTLTSLLYTFFFSKDRHFRVWQAVTEPPWKTWKQTSPPAEEQTKEARRWNHPATVDIAAARRKQYSTPIRASKYPATVDVTAGRRGASAVSGSGYYDQNSERRQPDFPGPPVGSDGRSIEPLDAFHYLARMNHPQCLRRALEEPPNNSAFLTATSMARGILPFLSTAQRDRDITGAPSVSVLIASGGPLGMMPLHEAAKCDAFEFLSAVIDAFWRFMDIDVPDFLNRTALFYVSQSGHVRVVELLLHRRAQRTRADWFGSTPVHEAASRGHLATVQLLLTRTVSRFCSEPAVKAVDVVDISGATPLSRACRLGDPDIVSVLARHSSGRTVVNAVWGCLQWGTTPPGILVALVTACASARWGPGRAPLQELVREAGLPFHSGRPRQWDSRSDAVLILETFLNHGYPVDLEDLNHDTALTYALREGEEGLSLRLLDRGAQWAKALRGQQCAQQMGGLFTNAVARGSFKLALFLLPQGVAWGGDDGVEREFMHGWASQVAARHPGTSTQDMAALNWTRIDMSLVYPAT